MKNALYAFARKNPKLHRVLRAGKSALHLLKHQGIRTTYSHVSSKIQARKQHRLLDLPAGFPAEQTPSALEVRQQKNWSNEAGYRPSFTLTLPLSAHSSKSLKETVKSVTAQSYLHWTLCILYDASISPEMAGVVETCVCSDDRIHSLAAQPNQSPLESLNAPLHGSQNDYAGLIHEGDRLSIDALFQTARTLVENPELDVLYTDEIHIHPQTKKIDAILLKPDWSPEMLLGYNYLGSLSLVRRELLVELGGYCPQYGAAQDWDLHLRLSESEARIKRIPRCCYLRKTENGAVPKGTAAPKTASSYRDVLKAHVSRQGLSADVETCENGVHRLRWQFAEHPLVSIIIPNRDSLKLIQSLVEDLLENTNYPNLEIIVVDSLSLDPAVHRFYRQQERAGHLKVVPFNREFNYSAACNLGAQAATGDYLLFLNNDIEVMSPDWLEDMVGWASQKDVGVVGTKLFYPNGHLQHCGVAFGLCLMGLLYYKVPKSEWGIFGTPDSYRNHLAIMGACQMLPTEVYEELGGFDETYDIANSDVALCLRAFKKGYRTVYTPFASLVHHEGYTRGKVNPIQDMELIVRQVREMNIHEDPYYHPWLSATNCNPSLRSGHEPSPLNATRELFNHFDPPGEHFRPLTLNDQATLQFELNGMGLPLPLPTFSPDQVGTDLREAAKFVLHVLLKQKGIQQRFPVALSEGVNGAFCDWICTEGLRQYRIPESAARTIREVFEENPGAQVRQLYTSFRPDLRQAFPTALLSNGQRSYLHWLLGFGRTDYGFRDDQIWWFLLEVAENPVREFEITYKTSQDWQRHFPAGLTRFGSEKLIRWARERHRVEESILQQIETQTREVTIEDLQTAYWGQSHWRRMFPGAFQQEQATSDLLDWIGAEYPDQSSAIAGLAPKAHQIARGETLGLNVFGHFCYPCGLRESVRSIVRSLQMKEVSLAFRDIPANYILDSPNRAEFLQSEIHDVSLIHVVPDHDVEKSYLETNFARAGIEPRQDVYRIGYWYWELENVPKLWKKPAESLQELWAPTEFVAQAFEKAFSTKVTRMLPGVQVGEVESLSRSELGVNEDDFLFLFMFDMKSFMERKNPLGLISAFQKAFRRDDRAKLIIKVSDGKMNPPEQARLRDAAKKAGVILIDEVLTRAKSYGLIEACDCYVSLHRSEGLGLTMAEAMLLEKPVIATGYSGNLDFMKDSNSLLVEYNLRQLGGTCPAYVHQVYKEDAFWANPSVEHAASLMRRAYANPDEAKALGLRAQEYVQRVLSPKAAGDRMKARLQEISESRGKSHVAVPAKKAA